jgi:hypothetical protein
MYKYLNNIIIQLFLFIGIDILYNFSIVNFASPNNVGGDPSENNEEVDYIPRNNLEGKEKVTYTEEEKNILEKNNKLETIEEKDENNSIELDEEFYPPSGPSANNGQGTNPNQNREEVSGDVINSESDDSGEKGIIGKLTRNFGFDNLASLWNRNNKSSSDSNANNNTNSNSSSDSNTNNNSKFFFEDDDNDNDSDFGDFGGL